MGRGTKKVVKWWREPCNVNSLVDFNSYNFRCDTTKVVGGLIEVLQSFTESLLRNPQQGCSCGLIVSGSLHCFLNQ